MICPDCGKETPDDRSFCVHCGSILEGGSSEFTDDDAVSRDGDAGQSTPPDEAATQITPPGGDKAGDKAGPEPAGDDGATRISGSGKREQPAPKRPAGRKRPTPGSKEDIEEKANKELALLTAAAEGKYEIIKKLGAGGMANVYLAREIALDRKVAIKVLPQTFLRDEDFVVRFKREAQVAASLEHPNIVRIYQISEEENLVYFVMSFIAGGSVGDLIKEKGAIPVDDIVQWGHEVASALAYAHERGIVHRDLKPDNIMIDDKDHAILMDYGIARAAVGTRLTQTGAVIGTPRYMSPEQARGTELDGRSDIYSMGVVLYQMATGTLPFEATDAASLMYMHVHESPEPPDVRNADVPDWLRDIILKCLAKNPDDRFATSSELARALIEHHKPTLTVTKMRKASERRGRTGMYIGIAAAVLLVAGGGFFWQQSQKRKAEQQTRIEQAAREQAAREQETASASRDESAEENKDDQAFQTAKMVGTRRSFETYLNDYPDGAHVAEATTELERIIEAEEAAKAEEARRQEQRQAAREQAPAQDTEDAARAREEEQARQDDEAYRQARMANTRDAYQAYLEFYPEGRHATDAKDRIAELDAKEKQEREQQAAEETKKDDEAFKVAQSTGTREAYNSYLISYPTGRHAADAKTRIAEFDAKKELEEKIRLGLSKFNIKLAPIPAGNFLMGSGDGSDDEKPVKTVQISAFQMSPTEISQSQFQAVTGDNPAFHKGLDNNPVERVSWNDAIAFCNTLSEALGLDPCYNLSSGACDFSKNGFRLPTEAEWEYACRAKTGSEYNTGDGQSALVNAGWWSGNSSDQTHVCGRKTANSWGLFDMHGNVWEWCNDFYDKSYYASMPGTDPTGPSSGKERVIRGGSWIENARNCRSAARNKMEPDKDNSDTGFRIVRR